MAENLTPKKYIDSNNMKQILTAIKDKTPVGNEYVTEEQLLAKDYATKTYVGEQIVNAEHLKREIVTVLPSDTEASDNIIYMLKVESATGNDKYQEYMKIDGTVQMVGDTSVDLTDYAKKTDIPTTLPANGGNSDTVNNHTIKSDVPENAVFTDTIYDDTELNAKLNEKADKNAVLKSLEIVNSYTTAKIIPWSDGTHYRSIDGNNGKDYTDIITKDGTVRLIKVKNDSGIKDEEVATMDKIANIIKVLTVTVPTSEFTNSLDLTSRVTIPSGYKFLCWTHVSTNGWVMSSPIYLVEPTMIRGYAYSIEAGKMPTGNNESISFMYLVVKS